MLGVYLALAVIQGITEFLPISSSAHLLLYKMIFSVWVLTLLDTILHLGTLVAVCVYFRKRLWALVKALWTPERHRRVLVMLTITLIPTAVLGLFLQDYAQYAGDLLLKIGLSLLLTAVALFVGARLERKNPKELFDLRWHEALAIGIAQGISVFPGLSRSGLTIATGLGVGLSREAAVEFSFLASIGPVLGITGLKLWQFQGYLLTSPSVPWGDFGLALLAAAVVGLMAIRPLLALVLRYGLKPFAIYCVGLGLLVLIWVWLARY